MRMDSVLERFGFDVCLVGALVAEFALSAVATRPYASPPSPYVVEAWHANTRIADSDSLVVDGWSGVDPTHSRLPGLSATGSFRTTDSNGGQLTLHLHRGDRVLFRSGRDVAYQSVRINGQLAAAFNTKLPLAPDWVVLAFVNPRLPADFRVVFDDDGNGFDDWSAVALSGDFPVSAYKTETWGPEDRTRLAPISAIVKNDWKGSDSERSQLPGFSIVGSVRTGDADTGRLVLHLRRGDRVLYRSGPTIEHQFLRIADRGRSRFLTSLPLSDNWIVLDFSNPNLPVAFTAEFDDDGAGWGEWSAIALATVPNKER